MSVRKSNLATFLKRHRLDRYTEMLAESGIDREILGHLTAEDLRELGLPVGDRRKLLIAAAELSKKIHGSAPRNHFDVGRSERRHLTILFCDMVGSTGLARRLDPEDLGDVMQEYAERTRAVIERYGGFVAKLIGDGILAVFGYPNAHEDDVERALLAALGCLDANKNAPIRTENSVPVEIQIRIGLHTGLTVVRTHNSGLVGDDIVGAAPNIAQRLQSEAAPGEIVVSPEIRRLAGDRFEYEALEPRVLKGMVERITPYRVRREVVTKTRFEVRSGGLLAPLLGRADKVQQLLGSWARIKAGAGETVLVTGPAGIGKSRLASAFLDAIRTDRKNVLTFQCSPFHTGTPLYPVIARLSLEIDALIATRERSRLDALSAWLWRMGKSDTKSLALMTGLLSIDPGEHVATLEMTPRQQMEETLLLLVNHAIAISRQQPLLLLIEDVHWADPTTMRLIDLFRQKCRGEPVLLLATFRAGFEQGTAPDGFAAEIRLKGLTAGDAADLVREVAHSREIPPETLRTIVERGEGVPLFVEELTKSVVERLINRELASEDEVEDDRLVPESLVDSLSARLDALPSAKQLAQIAAAIGREVPQDLLRSVSEYPPAKFRAAVAELAEAHLIQSYPETDADLLVFSHALIQDVAYQLMLRKDRRAVHAKIVGIYERDHEEVCRRLPEILAHHCEESRQIEKAVRFLIDAGVKAIRRSANMEALKHLTHARKLLKGHTDIAKSKALKFELEVENAIGTPLIFVEGYTSRETIRAFERAEEISVELGDDQARFKALFGLWGHRWMAGHLELSQRIADEMLTIAENDSVPERKILAHRCAGSSCWIIGEFERTEHHFERVKILTQDLNTKELADKYAVCPRVVAQVLGGYAMWLVGRRQEGFSEVATGLARAYEMKHAYSKALAHSMMGGLKLLGGDYIGLAEQAAALRSISEDSRFPYWLAYAETFEGAVLAEQGNPDEGQEKILKSIETYDAMGVLIHRTMQLVLLSDIAVKKGDLRAGKRWLDEAMALGGRTGERQWFDVIESKRARIST